MNRRKVFFLGFLVVCLQSCQYQFGRGELSGRYNTISIPYAEGDKKGELMAEVIKQLNFSGALRYVSCGGDLTLTIKLIELRDENIGFRHDRKKHGELKRAVIPTETRLHAVVEISVLDNHSQQIIRGPARLTASVDFDHDYYYSSCHAINIFSLGQLNDIDAAHDAVMHPLNRYLAEKIVDYVVHSW